MSFSQWKNRAAAAAAPHLRSANLPCAEKARLLVQVAGRDPDSVPQEWRRDSDALLESLPATALIRVRLQAAGESTPGAAAEITLH